MPLARVEGNQSQTAPTPKIVARLSHPEAAAGHRKRFHIRSVMQNLGNRLGLVLGRLTCQHLNQNDREESKADRCVGLKKSAIDAGQIVGSDQPMFVADERSDCR